MIEAEHPVINRRHLSHYTISSWVPSARASASNAKRRDPLRAAQSAFRSSAKTGIIDENNVIARHDETRSQERRSRSKLTIRTSSPIIPLTPEVISRTIPEIPHGRRRRPIVLILIEPLSSIFIVPITKRWRRGTAICKVYRRESGIRWIIRTRAMSLT